MQEKPKCTVSMYKFFVRIPSTLQITNGLLFGVFKTYSFEHYLRLTIATST